ncbi:histidine phosphatase family protein [Methylococcus sp. EFPC2]|uniref:SixA phosphatase family protein n=1 Tax=Methylococcus sp. EFPC2 TaxID=2812648 RepID=UPI00196882D0|nr:histidine phosphatase family protein [Methylococcus sp. EFPC2]QSA96260.1 histidine phosphatase family protein [Methylococcus sp. EFPC2]
MKRLLLVRHAKSSWDDPGLPDRERPLNKRGKRDAPWMGQLLKKRGYAPDRILTSPAKRALKTASKLAKELGYPQDRIEVREGIYLRGVDELTELIATLDPGWRRVLLVGHNPELSELAHRLTRADLADLPTCGAVSIAFDAASWRDCARGGGHLEFFERPPKPDERLDASRE